MKNSFYLLGTVTMLALVSPLRAHAEPATSTKASTNSIPQSVFTIPADKSEGCDPFFPNSGRLWASTEAAPVTTKQVKAAGLDCLTLKGLSGAPSNPLAMINGRTMARGEDADISTDCGRLFVHCVDITTNAAIIEVGGERRELHLRSEF